MNQWIKYVGYPDDHFKFNIYTWFIIILWLSIPLILYIVYGHFLYISKVYNRRASLKLSNDINEVVIIVLGDLGHSPRMTYHAKNLQKLGYQVNLCGYIESSLPKFLYNDNISIYDIPVIKNNFRLPYLLFALLKVSFQFFNLISLLKNLIDDKTRFVLIQNPPCLPIVLIVGLLKKFWAPNIQIVIDWHNLNWSILNLKYQNENNLVVKLMKFYEEICCTYLSDFNITVTNALKNYLIDEFKLPNNKILTVYDRPNDIFSPINSDIEFNNILEKNNYIFQGLKFDKNNDLIITTSTSFTPDENFSLLVDSLVLLEEKLNEINYKYKIFMIVTGKGPLQSNFNKMIKSHSWNHIIINNVWLPIEEYPNILKISNLGISLHYSSSGLDLPMKIVDLFGSGIPVISMNYPVINELVKNSVNGITLSNNNDPNEMCDLIYSNLILNSKLYENIKNGALLESNYTWDNEWNSKLQPILKLSNNSKI